MARYGLMSAPIGVGTSDSKEVRLTGESASAGVAQAMAILGFAYRLNITEHRVLVGPPENKLEKREAFLTVAIRAYLEGRKGKKSLEKVVGLGRRLFQLTDRRSAHFAITEIGAIAAVDRKRNRYFYCPAGRVHFLALMLEMQFDK